MSARFIPIAPHTVEPFDGTDSDMVRCNDCTEAFVPGFSGRGCDRFIPSMALTLQRCHRYRPKVRKPRAQPKTEVQQWNA